MARKSTRAAVFAAISGSILAGLWVLVPEVASAWVENTTRSRLVTPSGAGCIDQVGGLQHSNQSSPMTMRAFAQLTGLQAANSQACTPLSVPGLARIIKGTVMGGLIKLNQKSSQPGVVPDNYSYCRIVSSGEQPWGTSIQLNVTFPTPPCGAGLYAQIICLQNVQTGWTDGWGIYVPGSFNAGSIFTDCNVSSHWHPANGGSVAPTIPVTL